MAIGTIEGTTSSRYCISKIEWSSEANNDTNTSEITATLYLKRTNDVSTTGQEWSFDISIDGKKTSKTNFPLTIKNEWVEVMSATATVDHNGDGTKAITISASGGNPDNSVSSISCSGTAVLDTIPRSSTIISASPVTLGEKCNVKWRPSSATFWYKLLFYAEGVEGYNEFYTPAINPNTTEEFTYTGFAVPLSAAESFPDSKNGTMYVSLYTYSDSNCEIQVGNPSTTDIEITVPSSTAPTVSFASIVSMHDLPEIFSGLYVQGYSKVKVLMGATTKYGAGIELFDFTVDGNTYGQNENFTSAPIATPGLISVIGHAKDTRGYDGYVEAQINVVPYNSPKLQNLEVKRCDSNGEEDENGTYLLICAKRDYSKVESDGEQKNFCSIKYRYKSESGSYGEWETILEGNDLTTDEVVTDALLGGLLAIDSAYQVQVKAEDLISNSPYATKVIPTEKVYDHADGARRSYTFGGYVEDDNTFAIAPDIVFKAKGGIAPIGLCDNNDFNDLRYLTGYYTCFTSPSLSGCSNYPVDKPGVLSVIAFNGNAWQTYRSSDDEIYTRCCFNEVWKNWKN